MIKAIVFDLDDTLFDEREYVISGFHKIVPIFSKRIHNVDILNQLIELYDINPKNVFQRFLSKFNCEDTKLIEEAINAYRHNIPTKLLPFADTVSTLTALKDKGYKLGLVSDGIVSTQNAKLEALGLKHFFDAIIFSDEFGVEFRKPNALPFLAVCNELKTLPQDVAYIGDNPRKDFFISSQLPIVTIRVLRPKTLYFNEDYLDGVKENKSINTLSQLLDIFDKKVD